MIIAVVLKIIRKYLNPDTVTQNTCLGGHEVTRLDGNCLMLNQAATIK